MLLAEASCSMSSSRPIELTPIRPILKLNKEDVRFVEADAVAESLDERTNLLNDDSCLLVIRSY